MEKINYLSFLFFNLGKNFTTDMQSGRKMSISVTRKFKGSKLIKILAFEVHYERVCTETLQHLLHTDKYDNFNDLLTKVRDQVQ